MTTAQSSHEVQDAGLVTEVIDRLGPVAVMESVRDADATIVDFTYRLVNHSFARTLHESVETLVGARLLELYPSHLELGLFDAYREVVETGVPFTGELPWFDERNVRAFLEVHVTRFRDGYLMIGRDITEAKMATEVARIFESAQDSIIGTDADGVITAWNAGAEDLYGFSADEAVGRHISVCVPAALGPPRGEEVSLVSHAAGPHPVRPPESGSTAVSWLHITSPEVEVWSGFSRRWLPGFLVNGVNPDGTVEVRRSDGVALPQPFDPDMVRPAAGRSASRWGR